MSQSAVSGAASTPEVSSAAPTPEVSGAAPTSEVFGKMMKNLDILRQRKKDAREQYARAFMGYEQDFNYEYAVSSNARAGHWEASNFAEQVETGNILVEAINKELRRNLNVVCNAYVYTTNYYNASNVLMQAQEKTVNMMQARRKYLDDTIAALKQESEDLNANILSVQEKSKEDPGDKEVAFLKNRISNLKLELTELTTDDTEPCAECPYMREHMK
jgi:predicted RNase H-like nuclease (RuvC/YqgF family)